MDLKNLSETASKRWELCKSCENFKESTKQCSKCGCFMFLKILVPTAQCPIDKW